MTNNLNIKKIKYFTITIIYIYFGTVFAQDNTNNNMDDFFRMNMLFLEIERQKQLSTIYTYRDIVGSFWVRECNHFLQEIDDIYDISNGRGFIFLPNNMVIMVSTSCRAYFSREFNEFYCETPVIFILEQLFSYTIVNEIYYLYIPLNDNKNIFIENTTDFIRVYFEDGYLFFSFNGDEFERYQFSSKFYNLEESTD